MFKVACIGNLQIRIDSEAPIKDVVTNSAGNPVAPESPIFCVFFSPRFIEHIDSKQCIGVFIDP